MKTRIKISMIALGFLAAMATQAMPFDDTTGLQPSKFKNLMVVKAERKLIGAKVEVFYSNGDLVVSQKLQKRKLIIDFCDVKAGNYIVRITKGEQQEEYQYTRTR